MSQAENTYSLQVATGWAFSSDDEEQSAETLTLSVEVNILITLCLEQQQNKK